MGVAKPLGLILAIVMGFIALGQISALESASKSITTGGLSELFSTTAFITLLVVVVIGQVPYLKIQAKT